MTYLNPYVNIYISLCIFTGSHPREPILPLYPLSKKADVFECNLVYLRLTFTHLSTILVHVSVHFHVLP